jgi:hypothetical protein
VHPRRFGKTNRPAYKTLDPGPQVNVLAFDLLRVLFADDMLLRSDMPFIGAPPIGVKPCDTKGLEEVLKFKKDRILPTPKNI